MTDNTDVEPREGITITVPLDSIRRAADVELRKAGFDVKAIATDAAIPAIDQALVETHDKSKYGDNNE